MCPAYAPWLPARAPLRSMTPCARPRTLPVHSVKVVSVVLYSLVHLVKIALLDHMIKHADHCIRSLVKGYVRESKVASVADAVLS